MNKNKRVKYLGYIIVEQPDKSVRVFPGEFSMFFSTFKSMGEAKKSIKKREGK